jgi:hypothetical protein
MDRTVKFFKLVVLIFSFNLITACGGESNDDLPAFANPDAPEYRALYFFGAIYNERDIVKAQEHTTGKLSRIINSYGTARSYARYVLNLQLDPGVELKIDRSLNQVTTGKIDESSINILFTGMLNDNMVNDVRRVNFRKINGSWLIDSIDDDPYSKN